MPVNYLVCSNVCTGPKTSKAQAWVWRRLTASCGNTVAAFGLKLNWTREQRFTSLSGVLPQVPRRTNSRLGRPSYRRADMIQGPIEILLVEDNPDDVELTLHSLRKENLANHIHVVRDGEEALEFLFSNDIHGERSLENPPRLILLDLKLPKVDGMEVVRRIKGDDRTKTIPVVILTSSKEERDLVRGYDLGTNSYIQKPVDFDQFRETIKKVGLYWLVINQVICEGSGQTTAEAT